MHTLNSTGTFSAPIPTNEPIYGYAPGSPERERLQKAIDQFSSEVYHGAPRIGDRDAETGDTFEIHAPHDHALHLGTFHKVGRDEILEAIDAANDVAQEWAATPLVERQAIFLRAAELLAGPWRDKLNAVTILGQSKSVLQAEIDAACEMIDFFRFNCAFAEEIHATQPISSNGIWNRTDHRPLEGFVLAITPFNFTSIGGNLPTAPALMGNVVLWKPAEKAALAAALTMDLLRAAGLPDGVINLLHGSGRLISEVAMEHPNFAGLHFTGSTEVFQSLWSRAANNLPTLRTYPRLVGETGGKDFVVAHPSCDTDALIVALGRGAFEYQGQKCSAASRAYIPKSIWPQVRDGLADLTNQITVGNVADLSTFFGAVIDEASFDKLTAAINQEKEAGAEVLVGGSSDSSTGWFVDPTVIVTDNPKSETMGTELFGPVLTVYIYDDSGSTWWEDVLELVDSTSPYALTGAVFSKDRAAIDQALYSLRQAAGNFYINDKPTGAVVGQQPFGGARASGTNDKAGAAVNLLRWVSPRSIKETFVSPTDWRYPHMG